VPGVPAGFAWVVAVTGFPIPEPELGTVREFCEKLLAAVCQEAAEADLEVVLRQRRLEGAYLETFVDSAGNWIPRQCVGLIPHKPPPHVPTQEEIEDLDPRNFGSSGGVLSLDLLPELVFRISADPGKTECFRSMLGHGAVGVFLSRLRAHALYQRWKDVFGHRVTDRVFRAVPLVPLLGVKSFERVSAEELAGWFDSFELYVAESVEDQGILIASARNLDATIQGLAQRLPRLEKPAPKEILRW
jgi:hypothetical protein